MKKKKRMRFDTITIHVLLISNYQPVCQETVKRWDVSSAAYTTPPNSEHKKQTTAHAGTDR